MVGKKILIVEDELITATDMKFRLEDLGYEVIGIISNGEKAIETALDKHPDLILMDVGLKGNMNGIEASKPLLKEGMKVIYLTGHSDKIVIDENSENPASGFIKKPFDDLEFKRKITETIGAAEPKNKTTPSKPKKVEKVKKVEVPKKNIEENSEKNTIMVVEDEMITALDIKLRLEDFGYSVPGTIAYGEEAVTKAEKFKPNLILMDIMLKGEMNGIEATKKIQEKQDIPIIFLTANTNKEIIESALKTSPYGYIAKPFNDGELKYIIEIALKKHEDNINNN